MRDNRLTFFVELLVGFLHCLANVGTGRLYCALYIIQHLLEGISHKHIYIHMYRAHNIVTLRFH